MSFLKLSSSRIVSTLARAPLCVLLTSVMAQSGASNDLRGKKASVELQASTTLITFPCPLSAYSVSRSCPLTDDRQVVLTTLTKTFNKQATYVYTVTGGRVVGEGSKVTWDLSEAWPGIHTATVEVHDNKKRRATSSVIVTLQNCADCVHIELCPMLVVSCYDQVQAGTPVTCKVVARPWLDVFTLEWSVRDSNGEDLSERVSRRDPYISIRTDGLGGTAIITKVEVKGIEARCPPTSSGSTIVKP